jgi:hypothetical protein
MPLAKRERVSGWASFGGSFWNVAKSAVHSRQAEKVHRERRKEKESEDENEAVLRGLAEVSFPKKREGILNGNSLSMMSLEL